MHKRKKEVATTKYTNDTKEEGVWVMSDILLKEENYHLQQWFY